MDVSKFEEIRTNASTLIKFTKIVLRNKLRTWNLLLRNSGNQNQWTKYSPHEG